MKDYRLNGEGPGYIISIERVSANKKDSDSQETMRIKFADRPDFETVLYDPENIAKIVARQEEQAQEGLKNKSIFEKRRTKAGIITAVSAIGIPAAGIAVNQLTNLHIEPLTLAIGVGILTVAGVIPAVCSVVKNHAKVQELNKIKYRDEHKGELAEATKYPNGLVGISYDEQSRIKNCHQNKQDPFSITEIDHFTQEELETIVGNVETEKQYKFNYPKPKTTKK